MEGSIRIGGACGFWGEWSRATTQLLATPELDVLVYDYLAEITMSLLARARQKDASLGYATDFVTEVMASNAAQIAKRGVRIISNAGGLNPEACAVALRDVLEQSGVALRVAVVQGDDLLHRASHFHDAKDMFSGAPFPGSETIASINAYLGAFPIAAALDAGAEIVITGRCADSALALGACIHRFGWQAGDLDLLAAGALAGHLIECGPQATGGNFTDWRASGDTARIGYPVAEIAVDGAIEMTKPPETTGTVTPASVAEQMLYEIGDPRAYLLPDVTCDFSQVQLRQEGPDRVRLSGARGRAPSGKLKVSVTYADGYRGGLQFQFNGRDARDKAHAYVQAGLTRARDRLQQMGAADFAETSVEFFGGRPGDSDYGDSDYEEITVKVAVRHDDARAVGLFLKEQIGTALATPPGLHFFTGAGRPKPSPVVRLFSCLTAAAEVPVSVTLDGTPVAFVPPALPESDGSAPKAAPEPPQAATAANMASVPLERLAWARSGDKGNDANIGVIARAPALLPWIWRALTPAIVTTAFQPVLKGKVDRFWLPGCHAMNLLLHDALGGGGIASLLSDAQGKSYAQKLLSLSVEVPTDLVPAAEKEAS